MPSLDTLPTELLLDIFEKLEFFDLVMLQRVCRRTNAVIMSQTGGTIAETLFRDDRSAGGDEKVEPPSVGEAESDGRGKEKVDEWYFHLNPSLKVMKIRQCALSSENLGRDDIVFITTSGEKFHMLAPTEDLWSTSALSRAMLFEECEDWDHHRPFVIFFGTAKEARQAGRMKMGEFVDALLEGIGEHNTAGWAMKVADFTPSEEYGGLGEKYAKLLECQPYTTGDKSSYLVLSVEVGGDGDGDGDDEGAVVELQVLVDHDLRLVISGLKEMYFYNSFKAALEKARKSKE